MSGREGVSSLHGMDDVQQVCIVSSRTGLKKTGRLIWRNLVAVVKTEEQT